MFSRIQARLTDAGFGDPNRVGLAQVLLSMESERPALQLLSCII